MWAAANPGFEARVGQELIFSFIYSSYSGWRSKIGLLCEFKNVMYLVS
jgi:hypothetical protein